jgi:hypothetical protein
VTSPSILCISSTFGRVRCDVIVSDVTYRRIRRNNVTPPKNNGNHKKIYTLSFQTLCSFPSLLCCDCRYTLPSWTSSIIFDDPAQGEDSMAMEPPPRFIMTLSRRRRQPARHLSSASPTTTRQRRKRILNSSVRSCSCCFVNVMVRNLVVLYAVVIASATVGTSLALPTRQQHQPFALSSSSCQRQDGGCSTYLPMRRSSSSSSSRRAAAHSHGPDEALDGKHDHTQQQRLRRISTRRKTGNISGILRTKLLLQRRQRRRGKRQSKVLKIQRKALPQWFRIFLKGSRITTLLAMKGEEIGVLEVMQKNGMMTMVVYLEETK